MFEVFEDCGFKKFFFKLTVKVFFIRGQQFHGLHKMHCSVGF